MCVHVCLCRRDPCATSEAQAGVYALTFSNEPEKDRTDRTLKSSRCSCSCCQLVPQQSSYLRLCNHREMFIYPYITYTCIYIYTYVRVFLGHGSWRGSAFADARVACHFSKATDARCVQAEHEFCSQWLGRKVPNVYIYICGLGPDEMWSVGSVNNLCTYAKMYLNSLEQKIAGVMFEPPAS